RLEPSPACVRLKGRKANVLPLSVSPFQPVHLRLGNATTVLIGSGGSSPFQPGMVGGSAVMGPAFISGMRIDLPFGERHRSAADSKPCATRIGATPGRGMPHTLPLFQLVMKSRPK